MDREEFFRLKKVKNVKERAAAAEEAERQKKKQGRRRSDKENEDDQGAPDILGEQEDQDVIF